MNRDEEKRLSKVEIGVNNNTRQLEKIIKNDLPHIYKTVWQIKGSLWVLIPLVMILVGLVVGLYFT
ncbi:hypothetical protein LCGC14_2430800 [marine sediment metagenome]|uniref:Uncharacterized protein n=1 Tax=marine sediment metagenome TaxID=412755 RepID=A0A0F9C9B5_9ZZZZ